jgi:hypothetical protein
MNGFKPPRRIKELSKEANRPLIQRGYLAEDYDGIGQYILVALAGSSTSAAYRARIAPGDFGTGQEIPIGTPVSIFISRGLVEVLSMGAK